MISSAVIERRGACSREALHALGAEAARVAVKDALGSPTYTEPVFGKDERGKPWARAGVQDIALSIAHTHSCALACAATDEGVLLGADIEQVRQFARSTYEAFTTDAERAVIAQAPLSERPRLETLAWVFKESVLKALGTGLRLHPASVDISALLGDSGPARVAIKDIYVDAEVCQVAAPTGYVAAIIALKGGGAILNHVYESAA